jgi:hypothetical protein
MEGTKRIASCKRAPALCFSPSKRKYHDPLFRRPALYKVKPVKQQLAILNQRRLITMFTFLFVLLVALGWTSEPSAMNSTATNTCYCQTMPMKDWGK